MFELGDHRGELNSARVDEAMVNLTELVEAPAELNATPGRPAFPTAALLAELDLQR